MNGQGSFNVASSANLPCTPVAPPACVSSLLAMKDVTRSTSHPCADRRVLQVDVFYIDDMNSVDLMNNLFECKAIKFSGILSD
jgi:hypothetical protein